MSAQKEAVKMAQIGKTSNPGCLWQALHKYIDFRIETEWQNATTGKKLRKLGLQLNNIKQWYREYDRSVTSQMGQVLSGHVPTKAYFFKINKQKLCMPHLCKQSKELRVLLFHCKQVAPLTKDCFAEDVM